MENGRLKALFKLLTTENEAYAPALRQEIAAAIRHNPTAVRTALEEEFLATPPLPVVQALEEIFWDDLAQDFSLFSAKINPDLEEGLVLLSKFTDPSLTRQALSRSLDDTARPLRPILLNTTSYVGIAQAMSRYFFQTLGLHTLPLQANIKDISFARFLRKGRGSSLCVACLYTMIGTRYGLDMNIVDLAGRILVHLQDLPSQQSFFIDPLDSGKILWHSDCRQYLSSRQITWNDAFTTPLSSRQIVRRFIANMIFVLNKIQDTRRLAYLRTYLEIIKN